MIDLRPDHLEIVRDLLRQHVPECEVRAFGSRFKWTAKQASDLDLAVVGTKRLPTKKIMRLKEAFEESILPMRVDVLDWHAITPEFQRVIDAGFEVIQEGGEVSPLAPASSPSAAGSSATPLSQFARSVGENTSISWIETRIGDQVLLQRGIDITKAEQVFGAVPVISSGGTSSYHAVPAAKGPGVILGRKGVVGSVYYIQDDYWPHDTTLWVKDFKGNHPKFVYYFFKNFAPRLANLDVGSANPTLNRNHVHPIKVKWPSLANQKGIAQALGSLDDRIDLCRRTNETLESMARSLFKDWFIDFGPVRAKLDGRESYLPKDILDLFPARLIESERGKIPEGWSYGSILSIARLLSGGTPKTSEETFWDGNIKWASAKDVSQCGETFLLETERKITNLGLEKSSTKLIPAFSTVIVARGATTGRLTMFGEEMAMNQTCYGLHSKFDAPFALYCHTRDFIDSMVSAAHGSVFDTITTQTFEATPVLLPSEKTLKAFDKRTSEIFSQILANLNRMRSLVETRDFLLPRLLSGELSTNQIQGLDCA